MNIKEQLQKYNFKKYAELIQDNDKIKFNIINNVNMNKKGFVYLWVEVFEGNLKIVYVGKAGKTIKERCKQHEGGFNGASKSGIRKAEKIKSGLIENKRYFVYIRESLSSKILDEDKINMCHVEELALIQKFKPKWNKLI